MCFLNDLCWSMWFASDWYQVCEILMCHSDMKEICMWHGQMKNGTIWGVKCKKHCQGTWWQVCYFSFVGWYLKSTCWGAGWTSAFNLSAFHEVCNDLWRWFKRSKIWIMLDWWVWKKWIICINAEWNPVSCSLAKSLPLPWWCSFTDQLSLNFLEYQKVHFWLFCF